MIVYIMVDAMEMRRGRYLQDIRQILLAAISNVKARHVISMPPDFFAFLTSLRTQILQI
jgi:hypothetical protein